MELSRRDFIKLSGVTTGGLFLPAGITRAALAQAKPFPLHKPIGETPTICPFCAVGCGAIVAAQLNTVDGEVNGRRLQKVKYRAPGAAEWEVKSWDWAIDQIARRIKDTRDAHFIGTDGKGRTVNRLEAIASLGGAALDNEECSLIVKAMRALGLVYIEHQARI
jgi:formate dehydrogenase major subunit